MKIGLLEDDQTLSYGVKRFLIQEGYEVSLFFSLQEALNSDFDLDMYLVDISLPDGLGYDFVSELRKHTLSPVIYLSARDNEHDIITGFDTGADDYITKPFSLNELKQRINAISRRVQPHQMEIGSLVIDIEKALILNGNEIVNLSVQEYRILLFLARNKSTYVTRSELNDLLGIIDENLSENTLNVAMRRLRQKLKGMVEIETIHGKGYRIIE